MINLTEYMSAMEAILFASGDAVTADKLADAIGVNADEIKDIANSLMLYYEEEKRGISIICLDNSYQMCTNGKYFGYIQNLCKIPQKKTLTQSLLETLAIIAYNQPVTKSQIEAVRGVNADHAVNKLIEYELVCEKGRLNVPGKPLSFGTTEAFLRHFGLENLGNMPALKE